MHETASPSFGQWLRQRRKALDLTQEDLADKIGCSDATIRKIEAGVRRPSKQIAELLADLLNIALEERASFVAYARGLRDTWEIPVGDEAGEKAVPPTRRSNLPAQVTRLIGREGLLAQATALLQGPDVRLLTLVGPPGIGKTSLGLQVARQLASYFTDNVVFIPLAPISDPALVAPTVAKALGIGDQSNEAMLEALAQHLRGKAVLLMLDNFEQVIDAAPVVAHLLQQCPELKMLVTSRAALQIRGENQFAVPPLDLPDLGHLPTPQNLVDIPALALFIERAQGVRPDFRITDDNAEAVASICVHLEGVPLAIELAAARSKLLSPKEMQERLDSRFKLLTGGPRDLPTRQQTLRAAIDWSYSLLNNGEQMMLARLSVFVGGSILPAIQAVCNAKGDLPMDLFDGLESLLDKSLLKQEAGPAGESRFTMLEMIREYAVERLEQSGEAGQIRCLHAEYYLALAEAGDVQLRGSDQQEWLKRLEQDHDNMRAAFSWAENGEIELSLRLAAALAWFWELHGHITEGRERLREALVKAEEASPPETTKQKQATQIYSDRAKAKALAAAGRLAYHQGDFTTSSSLLREALTLGRQLSDKQVISAALHTLGNIAFEQRDFAASRSSHEEELALARELGDQWAITWALMGLGRVAMAAGDYDAAADTFEETLAIRRESRDMWGVARSLRELGNVARYQHNYEKARQLYEESLKMHRALGHKGFFNFVLPVLGRISYQLGDIARAKDAWQESLSLFTEEQNIPGIAYTLRNLVIIASAQNQPHRAVRLLGAIQALEDSYGDEVAVDAREQLEHDQDLALMRSRIEEDIWSAAWEEGRRMKMEEAILYALEKPA